MKFVIQRVTRASVTVEEACIGAIDRGFVVFIGVGAEDTKETADKYVKKLLGLRIFEDAQGKTNLSLKEVNGGLLLISQFTLYADCRKGRRPSFAAAARPETAAALYELFIDEIRACGIRVETGEFGSDMQVQLQNDGPVTILLDTADIMPK